ncbi:MAG TPA: zinc metalloprotease HtpX [Tepidisphaeraceae bacterium]
MGSTITNNIKTVMLLSVLTGAVLFAGYAIAGPNGVIIALILASVMNVFGYFFSAKIALSSMGAQEVGPGNELYTIVEKLVQRTGMPMPKVYISPQEAPNAFATGRGPNNAAVCATVGLMRVLDRNEIAGVMAHELAHVKHRDILIQTVAATIGGAINMLGYMFMFGGGSSDDEEGGIASHPLVGLALMILGPIAAGIIQMAISRQREFAADTEGARICGDPMHLATALEKIHVMAHRIPMQVNPAYNAMMIAEPMNFSGKVANLFSTHPKLEDRLMNLIGHETTGRRW